MCCKCHCKRSDCKHGCQQCQKPQSSEEDVALSIVARAVVGIAVAIATGGLFS